MSPSLYDYDKGRTQNPKLKSINTDSKQETFAPAPEDRTERRQAPEEFPEQLEALKEILAEGEDLAAEFAVAMRMEAKEAKLEVERLSGELNGA
jgi:hypothetical protein